MDIRNIDTCKTLSEELGRVRSMINEFTHKEVYIKVKDFGAISTGPSGAYKLGEPLQDIDLDTRKGILAVIKAREAAIVDKLSGLGVNCGS